MIIATPANSPCAPAIGASDTPPFMPVTSARISCSSYMHARKPCDSDSGAYGWRLAKPSISATEWQARGLYFIVHEPSG